MSNPGLARCKNCGKPIEHVRMPRRGFVWMHRSSLLQMCDSRKPFGGLAVPA